MTEYGITVKNLLRTFPEALGADENMYALATAIAKVLAERKDEIDRLRIYSRIDKQPEQLLDILAKDFKIDWFGYNYPIHVKRAQFRDSFKVRRKLGTPGAMEAALGDIYPGSLVEEWFEYGGDPYFFRVILDVTAPWVHLSHDEIIRTIMMFKPMRSHLQDGTVIYRYRSRAEMEIELTTGYVLYSLRLCGTYPVRATQGAIARSDVIVLTDADGVPYTVPFSGENVTGIHPATATQGGIGVEDLILLADADGVAYAVTITGTRPERATQGVTEQKSIAVEDSGGAVAYRAKMCGTSPGSLM